MQYWSSNIACPFWCPRSKLLHQCILLTNCSSEAGRPDLLTYMTCSACLCAWMVSLEVVQWWKMNMCESDWFGGHSILIFIIFYHIWYDDMNWYFCMAQGFRCKYEATPCAMEILENQSDSSLFGLPLITRKLCDCDLSNNYIQALFWSAHRRISAHFPRISDPSEISTNLLR